MGSESGLKLSQAEMFKEMNAERDARFKKMKKEQCCGELESICEDGFCPGVGWCPTHEMARRVIASFGDES